MRLAILAFVGAIAACTGGPGEGIELANLPADLHDDYALFARRCSKCHSLSRPLNSHINNDDWWAHYVARMRAMPGSGISAQDEVAILRFLRYYAAVERLKKEEEDKKAEEEKKREESK